MNSGRRAATGKVVGVEGRRVTLRVRGELWLADVQGAPLAQGEEAQVVAIDGLRLTATKWHQAAIPGTIPG